MGEIIKHTGNELKERWTNKMPRFFYWLVIVACGIAGTAAAINFGVPMLGGTHSEWWGEIYKYVISCCIGIVFACKFTVAGGYKDIDPDKLMRNNHILNEDIDHMSGESPCD